MSNKHVKTIGKRKDLHIPEGSMSANEKGCITKCVGSEWKSSHGSYRKNGHDEICGDRKKKSVYSVDFTTKRNKARVEGISFEKAKGTGKRRKPKDPREDAKTWKIGEGDNYTIGYLPFNHDYHHILPFDALKKLAKRDLQFLMKAGYNLNEGINLIILPCSPKIAAAHRLPYHASNHPEYIQDVMDVLEKLKQKSQQKAKEHEFDEESGENLKEKCDSWEGREFKQLLSYGNKAAKNAVDINDAPMARAT